MTLFRDRQDAGRRLAQALRERGADADLVLALPRGGVPVAAEVAEALELPLDVVVVRKLGAPGHEELALGAIAAVADREAHGLTTVLNEDLITMLRIGPEAIERVKASETHELSRRERAYRGDSEPLDVTGRKVIVVDDGVATGATMLAAAQALRLAGAASVTLAVPVAPVETARVLRSAADEVVCLHELSDLNSVGQWYDDFSQTTDAEVAALLRRASA